MIDETLAEIDETLSLVETELVPPLRHAREALGHAVRELQATRNALRRVLLWASDTGQSVACHAALTGREDAALPSVTRIALARCRLCPATVLAWRYGTDAPRWGYRPLGDCGDLANCGSQAPVED